MCRLLAYSSTSPRAAEDVLGRQQFADFLDLSHLHRDGWGMAWLVADLADLADEADEPGVVDTTSVRGPGRVCVARSVVPAYEDPDFLALAREPLGAAGFVHLRWATSGLAVEEANTHPFLVDGWAFAHQGSIPYPERIDGLLAPKWRDRRRGSTDSERYFLYLLQCAESEGDLIRGIQRGVTGVVDACGAASLNAMLLSPSSLVVVHGRAGLEPPRDDLLAAVEAPEDIPPDHLDGYFGLRYRRRGDEIAVVSSGLERAGWEEMPPDSILHVDLGAGPMSFHAFDGSSPPAGARVGGMSGRDGEAGGGAQPDGSALPASSGTK
jgi:predicted glutamine amidotransferase